LNKDYKIVEIDSELYYINNEDGSIYHIDFNESKEETSEEDNIDTEELPSETVKHPGSFKKWCGGEVTDACIEKGLQSNDKSIQAKAKLAKAFKTMRKQKKEKHESDSVLDFTFDMFIDYVDEQEDDVLNQDFEKIMEHAIKNKKIEKGEYDMDFEMKETSEIKPDGAMSMMERRITQCMEESGKSREDCTQEVRKKMHEKDEEAPNPEDMKEEVESKDEEDMETEEKDTVEVCSKEYDFLKKQSEELKLMKAEKEKVENEFESFKADFLKFKQRIDEKEANEKEISRQEVIKRISYDFDIPEDELKEDSIEELTKLEKRLELALRRDTDETEDETFGTEEDFQQMGDNIHKRYFLEV